MEVAEVTGVFLGIIIWLAFMVLFGFFVYWIVKFLNTVPAYLKRIAEALEKMQQGRP